MPTWYDTYDTKLRNITGDVPAASLAIRDVTNTSQWALTVMGVEDVVGLRDALNNWLREHHPEPAALGYLWSCAICQLPLTTQFTEDENHVISGERWVHREER